MKAELIEWKNRFIDVLTPRFLELFDELINELDSINSEASSKTPSVSKNEAQEKSCYDCKHNKDGECEIDDPCINYDLFEQLD